MLYVSLTPKASPFQDGAHLRVPCRLDGKQDPPIALEESHIASAAAAGASVHFFVGDTQAHSFTGAWSQPAAITVLLDRVLDEENRRFSAQNVVWTPGNNDGPHSAIFQAQDPSTLAWADSVLRHQIVTDDLGIVYTGLPSALPVQNQTALFRATGFYTKALPAISPAAYAIVLNTNLGAANPLQLAALNQTMSWIAARHAATVTVPAIYVLGHHPTVMGLGVDTICAQMIRGALSAKCRQMVAGVFAGHVHLAGSTTAGLFTLCPAVTQAVPKIKRGRTGFFIAEVSAAAPTVRVDMRRDLYTYQDTPGKLADPSMWRAAALATPRASVRT